MDLLTHFTSGVVIAKVAKFDKKPVKTVFLFGFLGMLPDIDNFIMFFGSRLDYIIHHRGITHSIFGGLILGFLSGLLIKYIYKRDLKFSIFIGCLTIFAHIFLDLITSYGTQILAPFSNKRFEMPAVFIIDFFYTLTMLTLLIFSFVKKSRKFATSAFIFMIIYPLFNLGIKEMVKYRVARATNYNYVVTTTAFTPLFWKVIVDADDKYLVSDIFTFKKIDLENFKYFEKFHKENYFYSKNNKLLNTYFWFVDYPAVIESKDEKYQYEIFDVKFFFEKLPLRNNEERMPFSLLIKLNEKSEIVEYKLN